MSEIKHTIKDVKSLRKYSGFDINKYSGLNEMSDFDILLLLDKRIDFQRRVSRDLWFLDYFSLDNINDFYNASDEKIHELAIDYITKRKNEIDLLFDEPLVVVDAYEKRYESNNGILSLSHGNGVYPMDRGNILSFMGSQLAVNGVGAGKPIIPAMEDLLQMEECDSSYDDFLCESVDLLIQKDALNKKVGHFVINFEKSDKELIESFSVQISKWRRELNIEPVNAPKTWAYIKSRLLEYNVIPLMDLLAFSELSGIKIPNRVLALALFPAGERDGFGISQTVLPFIENYINKFSIYDYIKQIYK